LIAKTAPAYTKHRCERLTVAITHFFINTLHSMQEFQLVPFIQTWENLDFIDQWLAGQLEVQGKLPRVVGRRIVVHQIEFTPDTWNRFSNILDQLHQHCVFLGGTTGAAKIEWIKHRYATGGWSTWQELKNDIVEMKTAIYNHMQTLLVMVMPHDKVSFYNDANLFDPAVMTTCVESAYDIKEAGKCFAFARWTATVFHLMRILENGVQRFANKLALSINPRDTWGMILTAIDRAINTMPTSTSEERDKQTTYHGLRASLHAVKEAWRNPTMHPKATYNEQEAREIFELVKIFMRRLVSLP
jgi:hypothetical protein